VKEPASLIKKDRCLYRTGESMVVPDLTFSIVIAVLLSIAFIWLIRKKGPRKGFAWLLLTIFLATWAGGVWGNWLSPAFSEIPWLSHLLAGLLAAILLWIFLPKAPKIGDKAQLDRQDTLELLAQTRKIRDLEKLAYVTIDLFLGFILLLLIAAIIIRYLQHG
jgi:hypothetical protein